MKPKKYEIIVNGLLDGLKIEQILKQVYLHYPSAKTKKGNVKYYLDMLEARDPSTNTKYAKIYQVYKLGNSREEKFELIKNGNFGIRDSRITTYVSHMKSIEKVLLHRKIRLPQNDTDY